MKGAAIGHCERLIQRRYRLLGFSTKSKFSAPFEIYFFSAEHAESFSATDMINVFLKKRGARSKLGAVNRSNKVPYESKHKGEC
jgi:hypothetical protein